MAVRRERQPDPAGAADQLIRFPAVVVRRAGVLVGREVGRRVEARQRGVTSLAVGRVPQADGLAGFRQVLVNGENENVFEAPDKKFAVLTILSALNWITEWYDPKGKMTPDEIAEHLTEFILTGLRVKTSV